MQTLTIVHWSGIFAHINLKNRGYIKKGIYIYNDSKSSYSTLLDKATKSIMAVGRLRYLCVEIYKTITSIQFLWMRFLIYHLKQTRTKTACFECKCNQAKPGKLRREKFKSLHPKIWNNLPSHLKSFPELLSFKCPK